MKKLLSVILILATVLTLCACGTNKTEVSVLWAGNDDHAVNPDSLINAMDRAMYIENINYAHYAASGDQTKQTQQATECLEKGCSALVVELVDTSAAQSIVDLAKAKNVPVVFFGTAVDQAVVDSYDKCAAVATAENSLPQVYDKMVCTYLGDKLGKPETIDLDGNGKIVYITIGDVALNSSSASDKKGKNTLELVHADAAFEDLQLKVESREAKKMIFFKTVEDHYMLTTADGSVVELILCDNDVQALDTLVALQGLGLNADKLATCFVPVFTIGNNADYKAYVMKDMPTDAEGRQLHLAKMSMLADMTGLKQKEWDKFANGEENEVNAMIFKTSNQIDAGRLSGTALENFDAIAEATAKLAKQLLKGESVENSYVWVDYTTYSN